MLHVRAGRPCRPAGGKEMSTTVRDRLGAVTGAAFVVLILVGNQMATAGSGQSAHPTGEQVLRDAAHQVSSASVTAGVALEVLGFAAFHRLPGLPRRRPAPHCRRPARAASPRVPVSSRARSWSPSSSAPSPPRRCGHRPWSYQPAARPGAQRPGRRGVRHQLAAVRDLRRGRCGRLHRAGPGRPAHGLQRPCPRRRPAWP